MYILLLFLLYSISVYSSTCSNQTIFELKGNLVDTFQIGNDTVLLLSDKGYVYRSTNALNTLEELTNSDLPTFNQVESLVNGPPPRALVGGIRTANNQVLYFYGGGGRLWLTRDGAKTFTLIRTGFEILQLPAEIHSTDANKILLIGSDYCCNSGSNCMGSCRVDAFVSLDYASSWKVVSYISNFFSLGTSLTWGIGVQKDYIFYIDPSSRLYYTSDFGTTRRQISSNVIYFFYDEISKVIGYISSNNFISGSPVILQVSSVTSNSFKFIGKILPFTTKEFPISVSQFRNSLFGFSYDSNTRFISGNVNRNIRLSHMVVSNANDETDFTQSLLNVVSDPVSGVQDFNFLVNVANPKGIIISNVLELNSVIKSKITFNSGLTWEGLKVTDCGNASINDCSLHYFGPAFQVRSLMKKYPPGISVVVGNIGSNQNRGHNSYGVYLTRDYGQTWSSIMTNLNSSYNIAYDMDSSSNIIALVKSINPTTVYTSQDLGVTWTTCELTDPAYDDANNITWLLGDIYSERNFGNSYEIGSSTKTFFYITASFTQKQANGTTITGSKLFVKNIPSLIGVPDCASNDYESYTLPLDTSKCVLGQVTQLTRKKASQNCQVDPLVIEKTTIPSRCSCKISDDYYCGLCQVKDPTNPNKCIIEETSKFSMCSNFDPNSFVDKLQDQDSDLCTQFYSYNYANVEDDGCVLTSDLYNITSGSLYGCDDDSSTAVIIIIVLICVFGVLFTLFVILAVHKNSKQIPPATENVELEETPQQEEQTVVQDPPQPTQSKDVSLVESNMSEVAID